MISMSKVKQSSILKFIGGTVPNPTVVVAQSNSRQREEVDLNMEGYQCQKSTLCNKRSNKKECGINKKEPGILQALA